MIAKFSMKRKIKLFKIRETNLFSILFQDILIKFIQCFFYIGLILLSSYYLKLASDNFTSNWGGGGGGHANNVECYQNSAIYH